MPTVDIVQLIANQRQRKWELTATLLFVCTPQKLLTDDELNSQRFNSKHISSSCVIQDVL